MRVISYTRVSTMAQADEGVSLDAQRMRIEQWARSEGLEVDPADVFEDAGISGKRADNRPALQAALGAVCGCGGVLVVYSLSRLARSIRDTLAIAERLGEAGADLVSLTERLETKSASGKMLFRLMAVLAEFERDLISERTAGALRHKRSRGERISRHIPYGSDLSPDGTTLVDNPAELAILVEVRELARSGLGPGPIARALNQRSIPAKQGGRWSPSTVRGLLRRSMGPDGAVAGVAVPPPDGTGPPGRGVGPVVRRIDGNQTEG